MPTTAPHRLRPPAALWLITAVLLAVPGWLLLAVFEGDGGRRAGAGIIAGGPLLGHDAVLLAVLPVCWGALTAGAAAVGSRHRVRE
jgi:hypothetical protein